MPLAEAPLTKLKCVAASTKSGESEVAKIDFGRTRAHAAAVGRITEVTRIVESTLRPPAELGRR